MIFKKESDTLDNLPSAVKESENKLLLSCSGSGTSSETYKTIDHLSIKLVLNIMLFILVFLCHPTLFIIAMILQRLFCTLAALTMMRHGPKHSRGHDVLGELV